MSFTTPAYNKATHFLGFLAGVVIGKTVEFDVSLKNKFFNKDIAQNERQLIDKKFQEHVDKNVLQRDRQLTSMAAQGKKKSSLDTAYYGSMYRSLKSKNAAIKLFQDVGMDEEAKQVASEIRPLIKQIEAQHKRHFLTMAAQGNESPAIPNLKSMHTSLVYKYFAIKSLRDAGMDEEAKEVASEIRPLMKEIEKIEMELKKIQPGVQLPQRK